MFLIASLINILYSVIWIAGVQVIFAIAKHDRFYAFGGVFQQGILKGIVDILHLLYKKANRSIALQLCLIFKLHL